MLKIYNKDGITLNTKNKYCEENINVKIDTTDLAPENILAGKRILGVDGTAESGLTPTGTLEITTNGDHDVTNYATASVNVPPTSGIIPKGTVEIGKNGIYDITTYKYADVEIYPNVQAKSVTPTKEFQTIQPDEGYDALNRVYIDPIPSRYIVPEGNIHITENGAIDIKNYATATINVAGEGGITPEGAIEITSNGDHDVTNYATATVNVPIPEGYILPSGNFEIVANGDYDISDKETVSVNVPTGGGDSLWTEAMNGLLAKSSLSYAFYNFTGTNIDKYLQGFDTSKVGYWDHAFQYCQQLTSMAPFDTSGATSMQHIFAYCQQLTEAPVLNTSKVTNMSNAFLTTGLTKIPNWDFSKVKDFSYTFSNCTSLKEATLDMSSATNISNLFQGCSYLKHVEVNSMDSITSQYNVSSYCAKCYSLESFTIRNMTKVPVFYNSSYAYPFVDCYHFTGTFQQTFNPEGLTDGGIYVPDEWVEPMKAATGWSYYGDFIFPLSIKEERIKKTKPYITFINRSSTSYSTWTMTTDGSRYYYSTSYQPLCIFEFTVPEDATSNTLTFEVVVAGSDTQRPYTVFFGKLDTVVNNYVTPDGCIDYKEYPEAQTYTVTYTDLTPGEHFIYIGANQRSTSNATTQYLKFRRID